jgi:hypothetical protein
MQIRVSPREEAKEVHGWLAIKIKEKYSSSSSVRAWREVERGKIYHFFIRSKKGERKGRLRDKPF